MRTKLSRPIHFGSVKRLYFVNARYSEKIIGPTVRPRKPIIHGTRNPYPATVSLRLCARRPAVVGTLASARRTWRMAFRTLLDPASAVTIDSVSVLTVVLRFLRENSTRARRGRAPPGPGLTAQVLLVEDDVHLVEELLRRVGRRDGAEPELLAE